LKSKKIIKWKNEYHLPDGQAIGPVWIFDGNEVTELYDGSWVSKEKAVQEAATRKIEFQEA
jgi:hypothetical protein